MRRSLRLSRDTRAIPPLASAQETKPSVFIERRCDGFMDVDSGIRDSIHDIQQEVRTTDFKLAANRDVATLVLVVLARGIVTNGSVGVSSSSVSAGTGSGFGFVMPNSVPTLTTLLSVGHYERRFQSEGATWSRAAKVVVQDVMAWWEANQAAVAQTVK